MPKIVKSARGNLVDFDLLKIKQQIGATPKTTNVKAREDFIDQKFKRRLKKATRDAVSSVAKAPQPVLPIKENKENKENIEEPNDQQLPEVDQDNTEPEGDDNADKADS